MHTIESFCCQKESCPDVGKRGAGNLRFHGYSGSSKTIRLLFCRTCGAYFSERKGTALFYAHLPTERVVSILEHLREGCGVRATARLTRADKNTVMRYARLEGEHSKRLHDELVAFSPRNA